MIHCSISANYFTLAVLVECQYEGSFIQAIFVVLKLQLV